MEQPVWRGKGERALNLMPILWPLKVLVHEGLGTSRLPYLLQKSRAD
jgi:hypothetical protein